MAKMLIGPLEAAFLGFLIRALGVKEILEIGTFTGYSALAMAEHLPEGGRVLTCDINEETVNIGRKFWAESPHGKKITPVIGPATHTLGNCCRG